MNQEKGDYIVRCEDIETTKHKILTIDNTIPIDPIGTKFLLIYTTKENANKIQALGINITYDEPTLTTC